MILMLRVALTNWQIINQDILEWCKSYKGEKFHAILCDPPYQLGFMGKDWDKSGISFNPETWKALGEHLHDGAFGVAFSSSRGWHRMAVAIEDAGFVIHPTIFGYAFGSGFPKATRIDHQVWAGHRYGLQALKPALEPIIVFSKSPCDGSRCGHNSKKRPSVEPIIVFQKPYKGKPIQNIIETGAGALNIDLCRISLQEKGEDKRLGGQGNWSTDKTAKNVYTGMYKGIRVNSSKLGRWPANFIILDEQAKEALDKQSGILKSGDNCIRTKPGNGYHGNMGKAGDIQISYGDEGGASRFFFTVQNQIDEADPIFYCAKTSKIERNAGLDDFEEVACGMMEDDNYPIKTGSGNLRHTKNRNHHPCVKPLSLTKYLATLLLPPEGYHRRILIPFAGVGSEMIGAMQAGWDESIGIELSEEYVTLAEARLQYWINNKELEKRKDPQLNLQLDLL